MSDNLAYQEERREELIGGKVVMMAPASGFYSEPGYGRNEVRIAYVLKKEDLQRALVILAKALEAYNNR